jgi:hypothetical protein
MKLIGTNGWRKIVKVARAVRKWAEAEQRKTNWYPESLCGMCARAAAKLAATLRAAGFNTSIRVMTYNCAHASVLLNNTYIVDVTATQFGEPPVVIARRLKVGFRFKWWWREVNLHSEHEDLKTFSVWQRLKGWCETQTAAGDDLVPLDLTY